MFQLFFGGVWQVASTVCLVAVLGYILLTAAKHREIKNWGRRAATLVALGLLLCVLVVLRDDYAAAVQGGAGFFALDSPQVMLAYLGAAVAGTSALSCLFVRSAHWRKAMFFVLSGAVIFKAAVIELSRLIL